MLRLGTLPDDRRDRAFDAIYSNAMRQTRLIDELLDMARIMAGKLRLDRADVDPRELATAALEIVQIAAEAKGVRVDVHIDEPLGFFYADSARLHQVLWNLLSNAIKFTPPGGVVRVSLARHGDWGEFVVADSGIGIPREFLPNVFEPFRQADATATREHAGLGLGLAIVKQLVQAHGGTITVDSPGKGQGATFTVRIPVVAPSRRRAVADARKQALPPKSLKGLSVLVVDDDGDSRDVVSAHLETHEATVYTARSAAEAFEVLERKPVDVLLSDLAMPGEDGFSLLRRLRSLSSKTSMVPAAALTAFVREEDRQEAFEAGFQMHLAKPVDSATLIAAVAALARDSTLDCH